MRIYWKLVLIVLPMELFLSGLDLYAVIDSHLNGGEWWPWIISFVFNLPISPIILRVLDVTSPHLNFYAQQIVAFLLFVVIGTLLWSLLLHVVIWFLSWLLGAMRRTYR